MEPKIPEASEYAEAIGAILKASGQTGYSLAKETNLTRTEVYRFKKGELIPNVNDMATIEDHLGLRRGEILRQAGWLPNDQRPTT